ncbi:hypothetical protein JY68_05410 [Neisseria meningitidis]|nr:hypothetical protein N875_02125 [Neisseria meningitidis LNP21362]MBG8748607.1 hypothetical protein [Neisseria meningitidis]MDM1031091.1 hypothetical protein [Neisseria meningitidis]PKT83715.1 hypothetical protein CWI49_12220 [Neisseria meningitidis]PKT88731.1 hypothetical protein CWI59_02500 [Neisseria meningitidis]
MPSFPFFLFHHSYFHAVILAKAEKSKAETQDPVIPAQAGIQFVRFQPFPINRLSIWVLDSHFHGNDAERFLFFKF